ncbi:hypothetical protein [Gallibacterium anatis]|uniref:hypothetical protein n=1 Tax=Gallibacterium anatis TaxID=750 RepID=UPI000AC81EB3|nr:hypothetical protein [Gallibacterium anatis]
MSKRVKNTTVPKNKSHGYGKPSVGKLSKLAQQSKKNNGGLTKARLLLLELMQ